MLHHVAVKSVIVLLHGSALAEMWAVVDIAGGKNARGREPEPVAQFFDLLHCLCSGPCFNRLQDITRIFVFEAFGRVVELFKECGLAHRLAKTLKLLFSESGYCHPSVRAPEKVGGTDRKVAVPGPLSVRAGFMCKEPGPVEPANDVFHLHVVDELAFARSFPVIESSHDADRAHQTGDPVCDPDTGFDRPALLEPRDGRKRSHTLGHRIVGRSSSPRAPAPITGDVKLDDPRIDFPEFLIAEPPRGQSARREIVDDNVGLLNQIEKNLFRLWVSHVHPNPVLIMVLDLQAW